MSSLLLFLLPVLVPRLYAGSQCKDCESLIMKDGASDENFKLVIPIENVCADASATECSESEFCIYAKRDLRLVYTDGQTPTEEASRISLQCMDKNYLDIATCGIMYVPNYPMYLETIAEVQINQCEVKIDADIPPTAFGLPEKDSESDQTDSGSSQTDSGSDQTDAESDQTDTESETDEESGETDSDSDSSVPAGGIKCHSCMTMTLIGADGSETEMTVTEDDGSTEAPCSDPTTEACREPLATSCTTITLTYTMQSMNIRQVKKSCSIPGMSCDLLKSFMTEAEVTDCDIVVTEALAEEDGDKDEGDDSHDNDGGNQTGDETESKNNDTENEIDDSDNEYTVNEPKEEAAKSSSTTYFLSFIIIIPLSSLVNLW